jgi:hypothetical protein
MPSHTHTATSTVTDPGHHHSYYTAFSAVGGAAGSDLRNGYGYYSTGDSVTGITVATTNATAGSGTSFSILNPYYALAFIQKA